MTPDEFAIYDAAYVLGALAPQERQAFEEHLQECPRCTEAVRELAALPGLLARAHGSAGDSGAEDAPGSGRDSGTAGSFACSSGFPDSAGAAGGSGAPDSSAGAASEPPDLLPALLGKVRRQRRIRRSVTGGVAAVAVAAGVALVVALTLPADSPASPPEPPALAMSALGEYPIHAAARLETQPWGTEVEMSCTYGGGRSGDYSLVAISRDGTETQLATWQALPETTAKVAVGTAMRPADIHTLELRTVRTGKPLMRLVYP